MKKRMYILIAALLMMAMTALCPGSLAAADYVSIKELRETLPQRWTGEYVVEHGAPNQLEKGDTVAVDVPIVVPEVDAVPVVRITWEPPAEGLDGSLEVVRDDWNAKGINRNFPMDELAFPVLEHHMTFTPELPWEEAPAIAMAEFQKWMPFMKDKELTPYYQGSYGDSNGNGFQGTALQVFYDMPLLCHVSTAFDNSIRGENTRLQNLFQLSRIRDKSGYTESWIIPKPYFSACFHAGSVKKIRDNFSSLLSCFQYFFIGSFPTFGIIL